MFKRRDFLFIFLIGFALGYIFRFVDFRFIFGVIVTLSIFIIYDCIKNLINWSNGV